MCVTPWEAGRTDQVSSATAGALPTRGVSWLCRHGGPSRPADRLRGAAQPLPGEGQRALRGLHRALEEHEVRSHLLVGVCSPLRASLPASAQTRRRKLHAHLPRHPGTWEALRTAAVSERTTSVFSVPSAVLRPLTFRGDFVGFGCTLFCGFFRNMYFCLAALLSSHSISPAPS